MVGHFGDHGDVGASARQDRGVDARHIRGDKLDELIDRRGRAFEGYNHRHAGVSRSVIRRVALPSTLV